MAECELKNWLGLQVEAGQNAIGLPQVSGSGEPEEISEGIELRGKKNTEMPESSHNTANNAVRAWSCSSNQSSRTAINSSVITVEP